MTEHLSLDDLADAAEDLLDPVRAARVERHLTGCAGCREQAAAVASVSATLAAAPAPAMPAAVADRLDAALAAEGSRRGSWPRLRDVSLPAEHPHRPSLGQFGEDLPPRRRKRWLAPALAAATAAAAVGFGGYVLSGTAGLNEPSAAPPVADVQNLDAEARSLQEETDLDPHRFSAAWRCARKVTDGRITGIANTVIQGDRALLVYTRDGGVSRVTVVRGCPDDPEAGPSAVLDR